MISELINSVSAVIITITLIVFFAGILFYVFSFDKLSNKTIGIYLTSLSVIVVFVVTILVILLN